MLESIIVSVLPSDWFSLVVVLLDLLSMGKKDFTQGESVFCV